MVKTGAVQIIAEDVVAVKCGNSIEISNTRSGAKEMLSFPSGITLDCFATEASRGIIVCGVHSVSAAVYVYQYPHLSNPTLVIEADEEVLEFSHVAISRDGSRLVTIEDTTDTTVSYWQLSGLSLCSASTLSNKDDVNGSLITTATVQEGAIAVLFNPLSHLQFSIQHRNKVVLWKCASEHDDTLTSRVVRLEADYHVESQEISCVAWSGDGQIFCGTLDGDVFSCIADSSEEFRYIVTVRTNISTSAQLPLTGMVIAKRHIVVTSCDGSVYWYSRSYKKKGKLVLTLVYGSTFQSSRNSNVPFASVHFMPSFKSLILCDSDGLYNCDIVGDVASLETETDASIKDHVFSLTSVAKVQFVDPFRPSSLIALSAADSRTIAVTFDSSSIQFWDVVSAQRRSRIHHFHVPNEVFTAKKGPSGTLSTVAISHNNRLMAIGTSRGVIAIYDVANVDVRSPALLVLENGFNSSINGLRFCQDDDRLAIESGRMVGVMKIEDYGVREMGSHIDSSTICGCDWFTGEDGSNYLAISNTEGTITVLDTEKKALTVKATLPLQTASSATCLAQAVDRAQQTVVAISGGKLMFYRISGGEHLDYINTYDIFNSFQGKPSNVCVSPDSSYICVTIDDGRLALFKILSDRFNLQKVSQLSLLKPTTKVRRTLISFSQNNSTLFIAEKNGCIGSIDLSDHVVPTVKQTRSTSAPRSYWNPISADPVDNDPLFKGAPGEVDYSFNSSASGSATNSQSGGKKHFSAGKYGISKDLEEFRVKFQALLHENERASDLERLDRTEFSVDIEQLKELQEYSQTRASVVRGEMEKQNLGRELVCHRILTECVDSMEDQPKSFLGFNDGIEVSNIPIANVPSKANKLVEKMKFLRGMEIKEKTWKGENPLVEEAVDVSFEPEAYVSRATAYIKECSAVCHRDNGNEVMLAKVSDVEKYLYHPVQCITYHRKRSQLVFIQEITREIKRGYNNLFLDFLDAKQREIEKVEEKVAKIQEIQQELKSNRTLKEYALGPSPGQDPMSFLTISDDELSAPPPLTEAERQQKLREKEKQAGEDEDEASAPQRALAEMMNGTLDVKRDLSVLEQELVREEWMDTVPENEMTDEQNTLLAAFEKRVEVIEQEKETRKKLLETQLNKLANQIDEIVRKFDTKIKALAQDRVLVLQRLFELESTCLHMVNDLIQDVDSSILLDSIRSALKEGVTQAETIKSEISKFLSVISEKKKELSLAVAEEKILEKRLRNELNSYGHESDQLLLLLKASRKDTKDAGPSVSSSKKSKKTNKSGAASKAEQVSSVTSKHRSSRGSLKTLKKQDSHASLSSSTETVVEDLNPFLYQDGNPLDLSLYGIDERPQDVSVAGWNALLAAKEKLIIQQEHTREVEQHLATAEARLQSLYDSETALTSMRENGNNEMATLAHSRLLSFLSAEILVRSTQGQIEIEEAPVITDFRASSLVPRQDVEQLNEVIRELGTDKVGILSEIVRQKRSLDCLQWRFLLLDLDYTDAAHMTKEIQLLRVTKNLQSLIKVGGRDVQKAAEVADLRRKVEYLTASSEEQVNQLRGKYRGLFRKKKRQESENSRLMSTVLDLERAVTEREEIRKMTEREGGLEKKQMDVRMKNVIEMRRLSDLAQMQQDEFRVLSQHAEELRRKTFACFNERAEEKKQRSPPPANRPRGGGLKLPSIHGRSIGPKRSGAKTSLAMVRGKKQTMSKGELRTASRSTSGRSRVSRPQTSMSRYSQGSSRPLSAK